MSILRIMMTLTRSKKNPSKYPQETQLPEGEEVEEDEEVQKENMPGMT